MRGGKKVYKLQCTSKVYILTVNAVNKQLENPGLFNIAVNFTYSEYEQL